MPRQLLQSTSSPPVASVAVAELRRQIDRLEGGSRTRKTLPFSIAAVDDHLPGGGLMRGARRAEGDRRRDARRGAGTAGRSAHDPDCDEGLPLIGPAVP
jgi:hypothetical protein